MKRFGTYALRGSLAVVLILAMAIGWSSWQGRQRGGWTPTTWQLANKDLGLAAMIQRELDRETKANSNIPGQLLYVSAPSLGLDQSFASGEGLSPTDDVRVASNTKTFVAAMALQLVEAGKLSLDGPIGPALSPPVKAMMTQNGYQIDTITLRQLLNHTSGIPDYFGVTLFEVLALVPNAYGISAHWTAEAEIWFAVTLGKKDVVGENFAYSDTNYLIAADMIKHAIGAPTIGIAARSMLSWPKIGADETYWEAMEPEPAGTRRILQYRGAIQDSAVDVSYDQYGGGGLVMSMDDLGRATRAVVRGEVFANPVATRLLMQTPGPDSKGEGYALGLYPTKLHGELCWGHAGFWGTSAVYCPRLDLTLARSNGQANAEQRDREGAGALSALILAAQAAERERAKVTKN
ncbi:serine hydrolase domain-containing protein [Aquidulcibacter paucihalophilus]|uniref:serine hydrolase domain-containing protein n=1 Tax=Aquidulcibacter paucihalophilus TaxID=1978549 RepID=UPI000A18D756|nr:serine hydrolase domain-containing protein [Aquidulcibacter paucihalophilus]